MDQGRPSKHDQNKIKEILRPYYYNGLSARATSKETQLNIKTVLRYYSRWDKEILDSEDTNFLKRVKISKEKTIQALDNEIISLDKIENEISSIKNSSKRSGNLLHYENLTKLILKVSEQKLKILSSKINLINTPTFGTIIDLEENNV